MMPYTYSVTEIQRFCMHDGPGIRTTVFLRGCPLRCFWCHNPETASSAAPLYYHAQKCIGCGACGVCPQGAHMFNGGHRFDAARCIGCGMCAALCPTEAVRLTSRTMTAEEILTVVERDRAFYGDTGGMTLSGGEPMLHPDATLSLLAAAKERAIRCAVETSGYFPSVYVEPLCAHTDVLLWDIKDTDDARHRANTGVSSELILDNLRLADRCGTPIILRCILLRGVNLDETHIARMQEIFRSLHHAVRVDFLPCHSLGASKAEALGTAYPDLRLYEVTRKEADAIRARKWIK